MRYLIDGALVDRMLTEYARTQVYLVSLEQTAAVLHLSEDATRIAEHTAQTTATMTAVLLSETVPDAIPDVLRRTA